jgi:uncharacterized protein (DUF885 family)
MAVKIQYTNDKGELLFETSDMSVVENFQKAEKKVAALADAEKVLERRERLVREARENIDSLRKAVTDGLPTGARVVKAGESYAISFEPEDAASAPSENGASENAENASA